MKLSRKLAALAMAVLLAVSLTACSPKQVAQDLVVNLVHKLGLVEESDDDRHHHQGRAWRQCGVPGGY